MTQTDQMTEKALLAERDAVKKLLSTSDATCRDAQRYTDIQALLDIIAKARATSLAVK